MSISIAVFPFFFRKDVCFDGFHESETDFF